MAFAYVANEDNGSYVPGAGIAATPHDLSTGGIGAVYGDAAEQGGLNRICIFCHAPHNTMNSAQAAGAGITYFPLWNLGITVSNYEMYTPGTDIPSNTSHQSQAKAYFDATGATRPGSVSRLCLSCHDGTVSTNSYGMWNGASSQGANNNNIKNHAQPEFLIGGAAGNNLSNHHPIGFPYANAAGVDNEIAQTTASMGLLTIGDLLWQGNMECTTCHDVHNSKNTGEKFLWISDANSAFCGTCHLKL
jgi:predicted CXXCH cytochrome family protein